MLFTSGGTMQKALELRIYGVGPVLLIANASIIKVRDQIQHRSAALFEPVECVFKRLHSENDMCLAALREQIFSSACFSEVITCKFHPALCHPLKGDFVVDKAALVQRNATKTAVLKMRI
ncbi:hypothetical protein GL58_19215 [Comamonas testosteroni]|uniref:Uncharacterized protein n=1 Tax=Comamonas testosteroni TaxID=285 RepID=A0A0L7MBR1_COMTE|nr:hypothetical protein GL58_19215 [Comamonas testosteroni]